MYEKYHAQGLEVLDFPCNQFGEQAPGTIAEIRQFCTSNYNTQFEQFAKIESAKGALLSCQKCPFVMS